MKEVISKAICLLAMVFVLASVTVPAFAAAGDEAANGNSDKSIDVVSGAPVSDVDPSTEPGLTPAPISAHATPIKLLTGYWWILLIVAGGIGACIMIVRKRKPTNPAQPGQASHPLPLLIGNTHHIGARDSQQDSFGISDVSNAGLCGRKGIFGVVADGMGGMADGSEVSAIVTRTMLQYFSEIESSGQPELDLLNMLHAANDNVNRFLAGREKGGSTLVAVILHDGKLYWIAVGDSRIYLVRGGTIMQINREHIFAVELDEKAATGEISWEAAVNDPQRTALTSYLGIGNLEKIDRNIRPMQLLAGDRVLLMSDGVFGVLSDDEILDAMSSEPFQSAEALKERVLATQNPNQDNLTAVILEYN